MTREGEARRVRAPNLPFPLLPVYKYVMPTPRTRRPAPQLDLLALIAYVEPGAQLDLVEEAGVERVGPSTIAAPADRFVVRVPGLSDLGPYTLDDAMTALRTYRALGLDDAQIVEA